MKPKRPRKPRTKAVLPKNEQTIVDELPESARNKFYLKRTSKKK